MITNIKSLNKCEWQTNHHLCLLFAYWPYFETYCHSCSSFLDSCSPTVALGHDLLALPHALSKSSLMFCFMRQSSFFFFILSSFFWLHSWLFFFFPHSHFPLQSSFLTITISKIPDEVHLLPLMSGWISPVTLYFRCSWRSSPISINVIK